MNASTLQQELAGTRVLLVGAEGQVGVALRQSMPESVELLALNRSSLDITDKRSVRRLVGGFVPDWVINAAAYTAVDKAESEPGVAFTVNRDAAANLADAAAQVRARMVQISTDYVFDGTQARPYQPGDTVNPLNVYGESKLGGEIAVTEILGDRALILRTAWVYSSRGRNFLATMLRLMRERNELTVVEDQVGTPTSAHSLAGAILKAIAHKVTGTHHWTDAGVASWYDFASEIAELAYRSGFTNGVCRIVPVPTSEYPTPARRPASSLLDKESMRKAIGETGVHWGELVRRELSQVMDLP